MTIPGLAKREAIPYFKATTYTTDATPTALLTIPLQPGEGGSLVLNVTAVEEGTNNKMYFLWITAINRTLAGVIAQPAFVKQFDIKPAGLSAADMNATVVGDTVEIRVVGVAGKNIFWSMVPTMNIVIYKPYNA